MSKKLLLADDSVTIQKVVNLTFADEGIDVITVGDGDTAIKLVTELKPDIVIADVHMPGLNGYQVCEKIKTTEELKKIPVILLVGTFEPFDEEEAKRVGADDFLTKPFQSIRLLISKVSDLLEPTFTDGQIQSQEGEDEELDPEVGSMVTVADDETIKEESPSDFIHTKADYQEKSERELAITTPLSADDIKEIEKEQLSSIEDRQDETLSDQQIEARTASETQLSESSEQETCLQELQQDLVSSAQEFQTEGPQSKTAVEFEKTHELEPGGEASETIHETTADSVQTSDLSKTAAAELAELQETKPEDLVMQETMNVEEERVESSTAESQRTNTDLLSSTLQTQEVSAEAESSDSITHKPSEEVIPAPETITLLEAEGDEILELPALAEPILADSESEAKEGTQIEAAQESVETKGTTEPISQKESATTVIIPPEVIDAIAQKVVEKFAERTIKEIAWEIVPQQAELIIKKIVEDQLKNKQ